MMHYFGKILLLSTAPIKMVLIVGENNLIDQMKIGGVNASCFYFNMEK